MKFILQESEIDNSDNIRVSYFYAEWMPFKKKMISILETIEKKYPNIIFQAIDVDFFKNLCTRFNVNSVPIILIMKNNKEIKRVEGLILASALRRVFVDICKV